MARFPAIKRYGPKHRFRRYWRKPYTFTARHSRKFKKFCWEEGYVSPHFSRAEWACKDGTRVPASLRRNAQRAGFRLERVRHYLGDKPLGAISYYRTPSYNAQVGGASQSRHMMADAADFSVETVNSVGREKFLAAANKYYRNDGVGIYPGGNIHLDTRGYFSRWNSW